MTTVQVDSLKFTFPASWQVCKYDEWAFYQNQISKISPGIKAVDILAIDNHVVWLIEAKDYRHYARTKSIDLADEVAQKVLFTLAAMLPAKINASAPSERDFAAKVLGGQRLRIVLHLEQPVKTSKLFPRAIEPSKVQLKLRSLIKPIDPHPMVVESSNMQTLGWTVT
ncbi:MAG: hypothetical protein Fur0025_14110 [Oscillatoriaceae cyanobacterium]